MHKGAELANVETPAKMYLREYLEHTNTPERKFKGVFLYEMCALEQLFQVNIVVYQLTENDDGRVYAKLVRRSPNSYDSTMFLNLHLTHFTVVTSSTLLSTARPTSAVNVTRSGVRGLG